MSFFDLIRSLFKDLFGSPTPVPDPGVVVVEPPPPDPEPVIVVDDQPKIINVADQLKRNPKVKWSDFNSPRKLSKIKFLVVHHTADNINDVHRINEIEINSKRIYKDGAPRIPYHYWINEQAEIYKCNNLSDITWHARNANSVGVGIALVGNYMKQDPDPKVLKSLNFLLDELRSVLGLPKEKVFGHKELKMYGNATACPGINLQPYVKKYRVAGSLV